MPVAPGWFCVEMRSVMACGTRCFGFWNLGNYDFGKDYWFWLRDGLPPRSPVSCSLEGRDGMEMKLQS
jgi:hypothetical protein